MATPREDVEARKKLDGTINTIKGILLDIEKDDALFQAQWFHDKIVMNKNHIQEQAIKKEIIILPHGTTERAALVAKISNVKQKKFSLPVNRGDIFHIKFGSGIVHELHEHHYGIVLARKGLMFMVAPLTSKPQDYGNLNYSFNDLGLPSKNNTKVSHVSFCHIRYVHQRRLEDIIVSNKIKKFYVDEKHVNKILENFFEIIKGSKF